MVERFVERVTVKTAVAIPATGSSMDTSSIERVAVSPGGGGGSPKLGVAIKEKFCGPFGTVCPRTSTCQTPGMTFEST